MAWSELPGEWREPGAVFAAGIISEYSHGALLCSHPATFQRYLAQESARTDLRDLRSLMWSAWSTARTDPGILTSPIDSTASPVDLAVACWRLALTTVVAYWEAIDEVASVLYKSTRAVYSRDVREIVVSSETNHAAVNALSEGEMDPWFLKYSRLRWMPSAQWFANVERYRRIQQQENEVAA